MDQRFVHLTWNMQCVSMLYIKFHFIYLYVYMQHVIIIYTTSHLNNFTFDEYINLRHTNLH